MKGGRVFKLSEEPDKIKDESRRLLDLSLFLVWTVHPGNSPQERVVPHRFVQIHAIQNRRIETCQQLFGDDEDLGQRVPLDECLTDSFLLILAQAVLG